MRNKKIELLTSLLININSILSYINFNSSKDLLTEVECETIQKSIEIIQRYVIEKMEVNKC